MSERVFLSRLDFAMANILNSNQITKQDNHIVNCNVVVAEVVVKNYNLTTNCHNFLY